MMQLSRRTALAAFAVGALVAGCGSVSNPEVPSNAVALRMDPVTDDVVRYLYSGIRDRRRLIIRDAATWTALWEEVTSNSRPSPPVPVIDFANEAVVVTSMGSRSTGGYVITIESVHEAEGQLFVTVREVSPGQNCFVTQAFTAPVHAVRVPRRNASVAFIERTEVRNC